MCYNIKILGLGILWYFRYLETMLIQGGTMMKKAVCVIWMLGELGEVRNSVKFTGVASKRYIYAKRTQMYSRDEPMYIRIARRDMYKAIAIWKDWIWRDMDISMESGFRDPRIRVMDFPIELVEAIEEAEREENRRT